MSAKTSFLQLGKELPPIGAPFAVFLSADDLGWSDTESRSRRVDALLKAGCRYFVCFGENSEELHDDIDEMIVAGKYQNVITTFHDDESPEDVIEFFETVASSEMAGALALVQDLERWMRLFERSLD